MDYILKNTEAKIFKIFLFFFLGNFLLFSLPNKNLSKILSDYELVWSDEFDGDELNLSKWGYRGLGKRRLGVNVKDTVSVRNGYLTLQTRKANGKYETAMIGTQGKFEFTFGYIECRAKLQKSIGHWSALWLQSPTIGKEIGQTKKVGTEIDIFEYLANKKDYIFHTLHWDGYKKHHKSTGRVFFIDGVSQGWHTFALLWTEKEYVFFVDGRENWRTSKAISHRSQYMILSLEVGRWAGDIAKGNLPDNFYIDYVRVYQKKK